MDIPFPKLNPHFIDPNWFNADNPCDEEAEITAMEQAHQHWLNSVGQQYIKRAPIGIKHLDLLDPMEEEAEGDVEEGNDESEESPTATNNNGWDSDSWVDISEERSASDQSAVGDDSVI